MQHQQLRACMPRAFRLTFSTNRVTTATSMIHACICAHLYSCNVVNYSLQLCTLRGVLSYCWNAGLVWSSCRFIPTCNWLQLTNIGQRQLLEARGYRSANFCRAHCVSHIHEQFHSWSFSSEWHTAIRRKLIPVHQMPNQHKVTGVSCINLCNSLFLAYFPQTRAMSSLTSYSRQKLFQKHGCCW